MSLSNEDLRSLVGSLALRTGLRPTRTAVNVEFQARGGGIQFLDAVVPVQASTTSAVSWTTFHASPYLPVGSTAALLQYRFDVSVGVGTISVRRDERSAVLLVARGAAEGAGDNVAAAGQALVPLTPDLTFDFEIAGGFDEGARLELIGYQS